MKNNYDVIIVGAGIAGLTMANLYANKNLKVLIIEKKSHIGGNCYDYLDENSVYRHVYGPHLFHTNDKEVFNYLSDFTQWYKYEHKVLGNIDSTLAPIPFNLDTLKTFFSDKYESLKDKLISEYGLNSKVTIKDLLLNNDEDIKLIANFVYEKIFKHYTMKQWDLTLDKLDPSVAQRVPINISFDDRYFSDEIQMMPKEGYSKMFENMIKSDLIDVKLNCDIKDIISFKSNSIYIEDEKFLGTFIYTGCLDELFDYKYGKLPYRSLNFDFKTVEGTFQNACVVNYPGEKTLYPYTRITEFKHMMQNHNCNTSTIVYEYPCAYDKDSSVGNIPYYPIFTQDNQNTYQKYLDLSKTYSNLYVVGRLAQYKYYNIDAMVKACLDLFKEIYNG